MRSSREKENRKVDMKKWMIRRRLTAEYLKDLNQITDLR
jgi:hypothetical protein